MGPVLHKRFVIVDDGPYWWYSPTAVIVKWSVFAFFVLLFLLWFGGGYLHAQRRLKKGLPPLAYHRFLVPESQRARFEPELRNQFSFYQVQNRGYVTEQAPPVYDPSQAPPPSYQPPEGASKVNPSQDYDVPPPGPPPGAPSSESAQEESVGSPPATARPARSPWASRFLPSRRN